MLAEVRFSADGLQLAGTIHFPPDRQTDERRPALIVLPGFGGGQSGGGTRVVAAVSRVRP